MSECKVELADSTIPLLEGFFGINEYVLVGNADGGWGSNKYAKRKIADIVNSCLPFAIDSSDFESNGREYINSSLFNHYQVEIFYNSINRYIKLSDKEFEYIYDSNVPIGINILIGDFDANVDNKYLIIQPKKFTSKPTCGNVNIINITDTSIELSSEVLFSGNVNVIESGIIYSENINPNINNGNKIILQQGGIGLLEVTIDNLTPNTTYYVRSYAINDLGTGYGEFTIFTTNV